MARSHPQESETTPTDYLRRADPVLGTVIDAFVNEHGRPLKLPPDIPSADPNLPSDRYGIVVRGIVSQNISEIASTAIYARLIARYGGRPPTPQEILDDDPDEMRVAAGLSRAKTASLRSLAEHILSGELALERLEELSDEDIVAQLSAVRGIGTWTADMFLMFHLYRPDVLPVGDVNLRRAVKQAYGLDAAPGPTDLVRIAEPWRPHRSLACIYLWRTTESIPMV
ncbi:MAG TPA: hypothetical protein VGM91_02640 [Conexibacter sp.]